MKTKTTEAAKPKPAMWGRGLPDEYEKRAAALRSASAEQGGKRG